VRRPEGNISCPIHKYFELSHEYLDLILMQIQVTQIFKAFSQKPVTFSLTKYHRYWPPKQVQKETDAFTLLAGRSLSLLVHQVQVG